MESEIPFLEVDCEGGCEGLKWTYGPWSQCSATCGGGKQVGCQFGRLRNRRKKTEENWCFFFLQISSFGCRVGRLVVRRVWVPCWRRASAPTSGELWSGSAGWGSVLNGRLVMVTMVDFKIIFPVHRVILDVLHFAGGRVV